MRQGEQASTPMASGQSRGSHVVNSGEAMSTRAAVWLAWSMFALSLTLTALGLLLLIFSLSHPNTHIYDNWLLDTLFGMSCSTIGVVIISRSNPKNVLAWLFCIIGFFWALSHFNAQYAIYTLLAAPGSLPSGQAAAWVYYWLSVADLGLIVFLVLLFPDSRLPDKGWRWFAWLSVLLILAGTVSGGLSPGSGDVGLGPIDNPLGIEGLPNVHKEVETLMLILIFVAVASLFGRLHRVRGEERQQVKWFAYASALAIGGAILTYTVPAVIGGRLLEWAGYIVMTVGVLGVPIAMGIAITRYHLYNIDILINRTLVYAAVTLVLAGVFQAIDGALHYLLVTLAHEHSLMGSIVSALVVGVLFHPVRHRIQHFVDGHLSSGEGGRPGRSDEARDP
jgi:hypothetical protein